MNSLPLFGLSVLMSFVAFGIVTRTYIWPRLRMALRVEALIALMVPHTFRFIGLSFLIPGVVSPSLPAGFSFPAAYGDLFAAILAVLAIWSLSARAWFATPMVLVFNVWGAANLLVAFLSRPARCAHRPSVAGCCVLHSHGCGAAAPRYARLDVLAAAAKAIKHTAPG